jgi:fumarate reductase subunit C
MDEEFVPVSSDCFDVFHRYRMSSLVNLSTAGVLGSFVAVSLFRNGRAIADGLPTLAQQVPGAQRGPDVWLDMTLLLIITTATLTASIACLSVVVRAFARSWAILWPAGAPADLGNTDKILTDLLFHHTLRETYRNPTKVMRVLASLVSVRFRYLRDRPRRVLKTIERSTMPWCLSLALLSVLAIIFGTSIFEHSSLSNTFWQNYLESRLPLPVALLIVFAMVTGFRAMTVVASTPRAPNIQVRETLLRVTNSGNPAAFYQYLETVSQRMRFRRFQNRIIRKRPPKVGRISLGETEEFEAELVFETQPEALNQGRDVSALLLEVGGASLLCLGHAMVIFVVDCAIGPGGLSSLGYQLIAGLLAIIVGIRMIRESDVFTFVYQFESDVFWVELKGTCTASRSGIGDGRGGQLFAERVTMQSDVRVKILGGRVLTECEGSEARRALRTPRTILDCCQTVAFQRRFDDLVHALVSYEDSGGQIPDMILSSKGCRNIISENTQISTMSSGNLLEGDPAPTQGINDAS